MTEAMPHDDQPGSVDLHTHSNVSDGTHSPSELVVEASRRGLRVLALTDHDTLGGLHEAAAASNRLGIDFIPGVELSAEIGPHEVHILGYFVDPDDPVLTSSLADLAAQRIARTERIVQRLNELGLPLSFDRVREIAGTGTIGRPHVARAMIEQGYVHSVSEAFDRYIAAGRPAFVPRTRSLPEDSVRLIRRSGAIPVLAHPLTTGDVEGTLDRLMPAGLLGMEVYYGEYSSATRRELEEIAMRRDLIPTGGSDYHGPEFKEGRELGSAAVPRSSAVRLRETWESFRSSRSGSDGGTGTFSVP